MPIYGDVLLSFPEQMETINYIPMTPLINAGYEEGTPVPIDVIIHNDTNETKDSNGNLVVTNNFKVWYQGELQDGSFVEINSQRYRIQKSNNWIKQGGFVEYSTSLLVGDDGTLTNDVEFNNGADNF